MAAAEAVAADAVAAEAEPVEPIDSEATSEEIAVSPDPGVASAIAAMESAFPNAKSTSSESMESAGEMALAHKMPEVAEAPVVAAASEVAAQESPATISTEPMAEATAPDADSAPPACNNRSSGAAADARSIDNG